MLKKSLIVLVLLVGCGPNVTQPIYETQAETTSRVKVTRIGVFPDGLAYNGKRGIYLVHDNETGLEYIGISGVGISELGSHTVKTGKTTTTVEDER